MSTSVRESSRAWSLRNPLFAVEADGVLQGEDDDHQCHASEADGTADVEETIGRAEEMNHRLPEEGEVADREQDAKLSWSEAPEGDAEFSERVRREVRLDGEHQERDEEANGDCGMHVSREREAAHERESAEAIDHVVDIESVARAQSLADAGECAVERVAEPVEGEASDHAEKRIAIPGSERVAGSGADLRD